MSVSRGPTAGCFAVPLLVASTLLLDDAAGLTLVHPPATHDDWLRSRSPVVLELEQRVAEVVQEQLVVDH